jgi:hypothetical protein
MERKRLPFFMSGADWGGQDLSENVDQKRGKGMHTIELPGQRRPILIREVEIGL